MTNPGMPAWLRYGIAAGAGFALALALVAAVVSVRALVGSGATVAESAPSETVAQVTEDSEDAAIAACREDVADQLKNPDSADFEDEEATQGMNSISWTVKGTVYATNGFGGVVPTSFDCYATWQGDHFTGNAELL